MYSGNLGLAHRFEEFLESARRLRQREDIVFLFVGDGPRLREVLAAKQRYGLDNVQTLDYVPREQLHASLSMADVHLISMRSEMAGIVVPGKLYGAMASGRAVLFVGPDHCETADTIRQAGCGLTARPGDVDSLVVAIEELAADHGRLAAFGERARDAFQEQFEREECCALWAQALGELLGATPTVAVVPGPHIPVKARAAT
jgi:glycosyltransferase involved in cell wall biosynthesis